MLQLKIVIYYRLTFHNGRDDRREIIRTRTITRHMHDDQVKEDKLLQKQIQEQAKTLVLAEHAVRGTRGEIAVLETQLLMVERIG